MLLFSCPIRFDLNEIQSVLRESNYHKTITNVSHNINIRDNDVVQEDDSYARTLIK